MKYFEIKIPIAGYATYDVEADSEEEAMEGLRKKTGEPSGLEWDWNIQRHKGKPIEVNEV